MFLRIALIAALVAATPALAQEAVKLKPGPGVDVVTTNCGICHTPNYIRMNAPFLTPDAWKAEVTKMQKALGAPFDDATAAEIVKYLSTNYAVPPKS
jgi:mono/diheme cytochrome c family protein